MVFVNTKKFACANCINGHRSSSCSHVNRPLYEIKKKGRPVSQCGRCRDLRKTRRIHVKCICDERPPQEPPVSWSPSSRKTAPRRIPSVPTLPNGLKDLTLMESEPTPFVMPGSRSGITSLLNPPFEGTISKPAAHPYPYSPMDRRHYSASPPHPMTYALHQSPTTPQSHPYPSPIPSHHSLPSLRELVGRANSDRTGCDSSCVCVRCMTTSHLRTSTTRGSYPERKISPTQELIEKSASMIPPPPLPSFRSFVRGELMRLSCCRGRCGCLPGECSCDDDCSGCGGQMSPRLSNELADCSHQYRH